MPLCSGCSRWRSLRHGGGSATAAPCFTFVAPPPGCLYRRRAVERLRYPNRHCRRRHYEPAHLSHQPNRPQPSPLVPQDRATPHPKSEDQARFHFQPPVAPSVGSLMHQQHRTPDRAVSTDRTLRAAGSFVVQTHPGTRGGDLHHSLPLSGAQWKPKNGRLPKQVLRNAVGLLPHRLANQGYPVQAPPVGIATKLS